MDKSNIYNAKSIKVHRPKEGELNPRLRALGFWINHAYCEIRTENGGMNLLSNCPERYFEYYSISHLIRGHGRLEMKGSVYDIHEGECVIIFPGTVNRYGAIENSTYEEDAVTFLGPAADMMRNAGILMEGVFEFGPVRKLMAISELCMNPSIDAQLKASLKLQQIISELYFSWRSAKRADHPLFAKIIESLNDFPEKTWSVEELAEMCRISTTHLRRLFFDATGHSPKKYIDILKMNRAVELLRMTEKPVSEIGRILGYSDPYHFSRRFKEIVRKTPCSVRVENGK